MPEKPNKNKKPKVRIVRINLSWIFYLLLIMSIGWMLMSNRATPEKVEWAQVESMIREGDVK